MQEATHEIRTVKLFLNYMADKLAFKGGLPTRTLDRQLQGIKGPGATVTCQNKPYTLVPLASLLEGAPAAAGSEGPVAVCVYVLHMISRSVDAPLVYVVCDNAKTAVALTVYNVSTHAVKEVWVVVIVLCCVVHCDYVLLCCAVLCCAVLCCAVLCCAVLCCAASCRVVPCRVMSCRVVSCCAVLCRVVSCCAVLCCAVLCCSVPKALLPKGQRPGCLQVNGRAVCVVRALCQCV